MKLEYTPYILNFKFKAGTSRGVMTTRKVWFITITSFSGIAGTGEVAPLPRLSVESEEEVTEQLEKLKKSFYLNEIPATADKCYELAEKWSGGIASVRFGLEMALLDLMNNGSKQWFDTGFIREEKGILINGLIWMSDPAHMMQQIDEKVDEGFHCIKMKIGAIDFEKELRVLSYLRSKSDELEIRVDANGAFKTSEVLQKLKRLSEFNIHSIEQPIIPRQPEAMRLICEKSPIPVGLDEELIGIRTTKDKIDLLNELKPQYIVLKPSLLGGFQETVEWIQLADKQNIGWWITSALESNLGLFAISQFTSQYSNDFYQGLGTGGLFTNNVESMTFIRKGQLFHLKKNK